MNTTLLDAVVARPVQQVAALFRRDMTPLTGLGAWPHQPTAATLAPALELDTSIQDACNVTHPRHRSWRNPYVVNVGIALLQGSPVIRKQ